MSTATTWCRDCSGRGHDLCDACNGTGRRGSGRCRACIPVGSGELRCPTCNGDREVTADNARSMGWDLAEDDPRNPLIQVDYEETVEWAVDFRGSEVQPRFRCIETHPTRDSAVERSQKTGLPLLRRTVIYKTMATEYEVEHQ